MNYLEAYTSLVIMLSGALREDFLENERIKECLEALKKCVTELGNMKLDYMCYEDLKAEYESEIKELKNELCLHCGKYKNAHLGACEGCKWNK